MGGAGCTARRRQDRLAIQRDRAGHELDDGPTLGASSTARLEILPHAVNHALAHSREKTEEDAADSGKRFLDAAARLAKSFKLAAGSAEAAEHGEEVAFFLAVRSALRKMDIGRGSRGAMIPISQSSSF